MAILFGELYFAVLHYSQKRYKNMNQPVYACVTNHLFKSASNLVVRGVKYDPI